MPKTLTDTDIADFRERLCQAALAIFSEKGADAVTIRAVAAAIGVSPMTPYRYFTDKEEMLAAIRARAFDRFAERLENTYAAPGNAAEKATAVYHAYIAFASEEPASYRLMFDLFQPNEEEYPELVRASERAKATMTQYVGGLIDAHILKGDPVLIGQVYWASIHGTMVLELAGKLTAAEGETIRQATFSALGQSFAAHAHASA